MATSFGLPQGDNVIRNKLKKLINDHDLPEVVFHSLRHTSVTYKLKLNGGDIKSVQGDSGHSQVNMVTDSWFHWRRLWGRNRSERKVTLQVQ